jgi:enamine deaminase RidA (YjgF/YER057c/UK114 family)
VSTSASAPVPQGDYLAAARHENLIYTAGMTPREHGRLVAVGIVGADITVAQAQTAARLAVSNALDAAESLLKTGEVIQQCLHLTVYVASVTAFTEHSRVADAASRIVRERLGASAVGPRAAVGVASLPGGAPIEVEVVATVQRAALARRTDG